MTTLKIYFENQACMNRSDETALIHRKFIDKGFTFTEDIESANCIFIYSCGVTEDFAKMMQKKIADYQKKYPDKQLILGGCVIATAPELFQDDSVIKFSPRNFSELEKKLDILINYNELRRATGFDDMYTAGLNAIIVQKGCRRRCAYCRIWKAVGGIFSMDMNSIITQVKELVSLGKFQISLTGDSVADYGIDIGTNIEDLLEQVCMVDPRVCLYIRDFHPEMFLVYSKVLIKLSQKGQLKRITVPIQSGSLKILEKMNRPFDIEMFINQCTELKRYGVELITDIIIGFPGETDEDFHQTIVLLEAIDFIDVNVNIYGDVPRSASSLMTEKVRITSIMKRYNLLKNKNIKGVNNEEDFNYQMGLAFNYRNKPLL